MDHKYLNKFKECALLNCGVQYTPDGNYATFEDGVMTAYQLTLSFQELFLLLGDVHISVEMHDKVPSYTVAINPLSLHSSASCILIGLSRSFYQDNKI